ncbi:hypothetical protein FQN54_009124 [Arachnomyces sp. PD_36]|nr:hypothetical protein FQN54_009124 [Arachnomyces sp. PD_36]
MADTPNGERCSKCEKPKSELDGGLKRCAKCKTAYYCSRDCQKADWKDHKKTCGPTPGSANNTNANTTNARQQSKVLSVTIDKPFHKLDSKTWLHDRPEEDVYKLLVDTYRMKVEDTYALEGEVFSDSIYGGARDGGRRGFRRFLKRVESKPGLLPSWWSPEKANACVRYGTNSNNWSDLACAAEKSDIIEHYGERMMPMQLRMFGEQVYGRGPGGYDGTAMRELQMLVENGSAQVHTVNR